MKPKNFPARKLRRKMVADGINPESPAAKKLLREARQVRSKISRK